ncbi:hypothetical protein Pfo_021747, partial [Paulownia fortunei]
MVNFLTVTCILAIWAVVVVSSGAQSAPSQPPAEGPGGPEADCSTLIYNMMDCMSFLGNGGDETTPDRSCCSGFKTVLKANADCICYALSSSASLGLDINMTRAEALPSDCGVSAPPISNCNVLIWVFLLQCLPLLVHLQLILQQPVLHLQTLQVFRQLRSHQPPPLPREEPRRPPPARQERQLLKLQHHPLENLELTPYLPPFQPFLLLLCLSYSLMP